MNGTITTTGRSSGTIAAEIRTIVRQTRMIVLQNAMEIGRRLCEAKELVAHGEWGEYLEKEVEFSQSTANNMMQLWREYGDKQQSLFGGNGDAFLDLPYTKALKLLAVPTEEREAFAQAVDAENISTRELDKAIREREEAIRQQETAQKLCAAAQERFEAERDRVEQLTAETKQREIEVNKAEAEAEGLRRELKKAESMLAEARKQVEDAAKDAMEQLWAEAEEAAAAKAKADLERQAKEAEARIREAEERAAKAQEQLAAAKKQAAGQDADTAVFAQMFATVQEDFNKMSGQLMKIRNTDPAKAEKLTGAVKALLNRLGQQMGGV